jgi:hypothetical protein
MHRLLWSLNSHSAWPMTSRHSRVRIQRWPTEFASSFRFPSLLSFVRGLGRHSRATESRNRVSEEVLSPGAFCTSLAGSLLAFRNENRCESERGVRENSRDVDGNVDKRCDLLRGPASLHPALMDVRDDRGSAHRAPLVRLAPSAMISSDCGEAAACAASPVPTPFDSRRLQRPLPLSACQAAPSVRCHPVSAAHTSPAFRVPFLSASVAKISAPSHPASKREKDCTFRQAVLMPGTSPPNPVRNLNRRCGREAGEPTLLEIPYL